MAARRLVVVMLVLLGISTLVAALVPTPNRHQSDSTTTTGAGGTTRPAPSAPSSPAAPADLLNARITVSGGAPEVVKVHPRQRLVLLVGGAVGDDISIPAFGLTETMTPEAPARFDLIVDRRGKFAVRAFGADRVVGRIVSG